MNTKEKIYEAMDSFLVETDKPRTIENLNQDRHLFVERMEEILAEQKKEIIENLEGIKAMDRKLLSIEEVIKIIDHPRQ